jgi:hypothetical protein
MLLEFGEQYALAISEYHQHDFLAGGVNINFLCAEDAGCFDCLGFRFISGSMVHPRLITRDHLGQRVIPFVLVVLEMLQ